MKRKPSRRNVLCFLSVIGFLCARAPQGLGDPPDSAKTPAGATLVPPEPPTSDDDNFWTRDELTGDWGDYRKRMEKAGVTVGATWIGQGFRNFEGGIHTGDTAASTFDLNVTFDLEKLVGLAGGKFYVDLEDHAGPDPSQNLAGDLQRFTKLNYTPFLQVAEIWYEQKLFGDKLRLKIGKIDANSEFSVIDNGLPFLNSSTQVTPTLIPFPTFPDPMPGVNVFFTPNDLFYASFGAFYANRHDRFLDFSGTPYDAQLTQGGMLFIWETGMKWKHLADWQADGNIRLGFWEHNGTFPRVDGGDKQGTHGFYAIADQTLWKPESKDEKDAKNSKDSKEEDPRGVRMFLEYAQTPGDVSVIDHHIGGGLSWTGPMPARPKDILGISFQYVHLSESAELPKSSERALEAFYKYQFTPWAAIQPDLQYIFNPGGQYPSALIGILQFEIHF
jgi:porin